MALLGNCDMDNIIIYENLEKSDKNEHLILMDKEIIDFILCILREMNQQII